MTNRITELSEPEDADRVFNAETSRRLRREALRRAAEELNTTSAPGLEGMLARISAEVTAEADARIADPANSDNGQRKR